MTMEMVKSSLVPENKKTPWAVELPKDFDYHIPLEPLEWLYKFNLTKMELTRNKVGYSDQFHSLIFPVYGGPGELRMFQARYFGPQPENNSKWKTVGTTKDLIHLPESHSSTTCVIVEDIVSAIKVSRVTNCIPCFTTHMHVETIKRLSKLFKGVKIWLDPDARKKALKTALDCIAWGIKTEVIFSDFDPKEYGTADIREMVQ